MPNFITEFDSQMRRTPLRPACSFNGCTISYAELWSRSQAAAAAFGAAGVGRESVVGLFVERSLDYLTGMIGVLAAGGAFLPLNPADPVQHVADVVERSGCRHVVVSPAAAAAWRAASALLRDRAPQAVEFAAASRSAPATVTLAPPPNALAYVIYTSGSTGRPKGAMVEHAGLLNHLSAKIDSLHLEADDVIAQNASQCFDVSVWQFLAPLLIGARSVILDDRTTRDALGFLSALDAEAVSVLEVVPSQMRAMVAAAHLPGAARPSLKALRSLFVMGEILPPALCKEWNALFPHVRIANAYGVTECSDDVTHYDIPEPGALDSGRVPVGVALPGADLHVLDGRLSPLAPGEPGELYIGGVCVGRGYLRDPRRTAELFVADPFSTLPGQRLYKTGDRVQWLPDGSLDFLGRTDFQVKINGHRIELEEVEAALVAHPQVEHAAAIVQTRGDGSQFLAAYVALAGGSTTTAGELKALLQERLPEFMVPARLVILDALPTNASGKIDRRQLAVAVDGEVTAGATPPARGATDSLDPIERSAAILRAIWAEVLGIDAVGRDDNFFDLGGDSIVTIQIAARAAQEGLRITPMDLFEHQTVAELARASAATALGGADAAITAGPVPLLPAQYWLFAQNQPALHHWNQSVMLSIAPAVDERTIRAALDRVVRRHDSFRLAFEQRGGEWMQTLVPEDAIAVPFRHVALDGVAVEAQAAIVREEAQSAQASFTLSEPALLRAVFFTGGRDGNRLLLVCHHLITDAVSMRIVAEELAAECAAALGEAHADAPAATTPLAAVAQRLGAVAQRPEFRETDERWLAAATACRDSLPGDANAPNTFAAARVVRRVLNAARTKSLLTDMTRTYRVPVEDVLLYALGQALLELTGGQQQWVNLEGHGRDSVADICGLDVSRTTGWFTTICPFAPAADGASTPLQAVRHIRKALEDLGHDRLRFMMLRYLTAQDGAARAVATPPVSFNYLGRLLTGQRDEGLVRPTTEFSGRTGSALGRRPHWIDVTAIVIDERLHVSWGYSANRHTAADIERAADAFGRALAEFLRYTLGAAAGRALSEDGDAADWADPAVALASVGTA